MTPPRTQLTHDNLVARLKADLTPVRPLWPPSARLASWLVLAGFVIAVAIEMGLRRDLATQLRRPVYLLEIGALLGTAAAAASAALYGAVPGRDGRWMGRLALVLGVASAALLLSEPAAAASPIGSFLESGLRCAFFVTMFGLLPWAAILVAVRRGAPLDARATGARAGAAAFVVGAAAVRVACPIDHPLHVLTWHLAPVLLWTTLSAALGALWLVRRRRLPRSVPRSDIGSRG